MINELHDHSYYDSIIQELKQEDKYKKISRVMIIDKFYEKKFIDKELKKILLKNAIPLDKKEHKYDLLFSLLVSSSILLFFLIVFIPQNEKFIRLLFSIYILCIYLLAYYFK